MAGTLTEDTGLDGVSGESRAEWRSSEQVENGTPSTSPPYYDTDDDDCGPKPSELFGKFTWKIESFSQINKRELKSNSFDVGGYKWYILIYPQGCDVFNHLSLFLCVANHDKLLPGWSHFAQFTISVVNKDAKKSKYSDTLHRFWKKEHDWGWKKFIELSKLNDGFLVDDVLIIKAQVQVIRERAERPFRCLDVQYRRELVSVYLSNVDQICRRFIDDRRMKISRLIDDKVRWSSFRAFWMGIDPITRRHMSREQSSTILKVLVKHFFLEKDVTSTVVMDAMYSGLRSLELQSRKSLPQKDKIISSVSGSGRKAVAQKDESGSSGCGTPMVYVDRDCFVLTDDVVVLLERAVRDTWPQMSKDEKGTHSRSKLEGNLGEETSNNPSDRENKRLTDLGRRTVEFFALIEIFNNRIEVAHQEAVALRRQEELIREEEIAGLIENERREKRAKKKQSKQQKKNGKKAKDKGKNKESITITITDSITPSKQDQDQDQEETANKFIIIEGESSDDASETARRCRETSPGYWETDASETPTQQMMTNEGNRGGKENEVLNFGDDSSSSGSDEESCDNNGKVVQAQSNRAMKQQSKNKKSQENVENNTEPDSSTESSHNNTSLNAEPQQEAVIINSVKDWVHSQISDKTEETTKTKKPDMKNSSNSNPKTNNFPSLSPLTIKKHPSVSAMHPPKLHTEISPTVTATPKSAPAGATKPDPNPTPSPSPSKSESHKPSIITPLKNSITKPSIPPTKPTVPVSVPIPVPPVVSTVPVPALSRSASSASRSNTEPSPTFVPTSYRNAITGTNRTTNGTTGTVGTVPTIKQTSSLELASNSSPSMFPPLERKDKEKEKEKEKELEKEKEKEKEKVMEKEKEEEKEKEKEKEKENFLQRQLTFTGPIPSNIGTEFERWRESRNPGNEIPQTSTSGSLVSDEFPHLDIINDLLDEDKCFGTRGNVRVSSQNRTRNFTRQYSMPDNNRYEGNFINPYSTSTGTGTSNGVNNASHVRHFSQVDVMGYANGYDELAQGHWPASYVHGEMSNGNGYVYQMNDYDYEYSNMISGVNNGGVNYPMYRPSNGY